MVALFCVVAVVFDVAENLERLIDNEAPWDRVFGEYYVAFCLALGNMLSAFIVFRPSSCSPADWRSAAKSSPSSPGGVFQRLMRPYLVASTLLVVGSLVLSHSSCPCPISGRWTSRWSSSTRNFTSQSSTFTARCSRERSRTSARSCRSAGGIPLCPGAMGGDRLVEKWTASKAKWMEEEQTWRVSNLRRRWWSETGEEGFEKVAVLDTALAMRIADFGQRNEAMSTLDRGELRAAIAREKAKGSGGERLLQLERHTRTSNAFAIYVMTLIGVSVASRKQRGGTGIHLLIGVVIGFIYVFSAKLMSVSATHAGVPPVVAAWTPNVLFGLLGGWLYRKAPK